MQNVLSLNRSGITGSDCSLLQLAILSRSSFSLIIPWVFQNKSSVCLKEGSSSSLSPDVNSKRLLVFYQTLQGLYLKTERFCKRIQYFLKTIVPAHAKSLYKESLLE